MSSTPSVVASLALGLALAGCAGTAGDPTEGASTMTPAEPPPSGNDLQLPVGEVPTELLEAIVADAADRAGVRAQEIEVTAAERVTWSDGSLGCPEEGMAYTQALVPGYRVVLEAGGDQLNFRSSESGDFRFCEDPQPPADAPVDR